ncbi:hypothetical protein LRP88_06303 [Fusarium phalaenopsidis]
MATTTNTVAPSPSPLRDAAQERAHNLIDGIVKCFEAAHQCTTLWCTFNNIRGAGTCEKCGSTMNDSSVTAQRTLVSTVLDKMAEEAPFVHPGDANLRNACAAATGLVQNGRRDPLGFWLDNSPQGIIDTHFRGLFLFG